MDHGYFSYFIFLAPAMILMVIAQFLVSHEFKKYSLISNARGLTGAGAAAEILRVNNITGVSIEMINGNLTDHFDPKANAIRLSPKVYMGNSIAAVGIAAHETGHCLQHNLGYVPIKIRSAIIPLTKWSKFAFLFIMAGFFIQMLQPLIWVGILLYSIVFLFQLATLPVEFDASHRAIVSIKKYGLLTEHECTGAKKVLTAAALTYVAAMLTSLLQILYFVMRASSRR